MYAMHSVDINMYMYMCTKVPPNPMPEAFQMEDNVFPREQCNNAPVEVS